MLDKDVTFLAFSEPDQEWFPIVTIEATDEEDVWRVTWPDGDENDTLKTADQLALDDSEEADEATGRGV